MAVAVLVVTRSSTTVPNAEALVVKNKSVRSRCQRGFFSIRSGHHHDGHARIHGSQLEQKFDSGGICSPMADNGGQGPGPHGIQGVPTGLTLMQYRVWKFAEQSLREQKAAVAVIIDHEKFWGENHDQDRPQA